MVSTNTQSISVKFKKKKKKRIPSQQRFKKLTFVLLIFWVLISTLVINHQATLIVNYFQRFFLFLIESWSNGNHLHHQRVQTFEQWKGMMMTRTKTGLLDPCRYMVPIFYCIPILVEIHPLSEQLYSRTLTRRTIYYDYMWTDRFCK